MAVAVLDASAILAWMRGEPGSEEVQAALAAGAVVGAVNHAEIVSKLTDWIDNDEALKETISLLGYRVVEFDALLAVEAGKLRRTTRALGLSLGDRACLALAAREAGGCLTADRAWAKLDGFDIAVVNREK